MALTEESIYTALRQVEDPELLVNIVDLGLVYEVEISEVGAKSRIRVRMTMTSPACPAGPMLIQEVQEALLGLENVEKVDVELVTSPPWTPERMTDEARDQLGMF